MTLLDAPQYDEAKARRKRIRIIIVVLVILIIGFLAWWFRYWPEEHVAGKFFAALKNQNYAAAYGIWMQDPDWKQHPDKYQKYPFNDFYRDWGPGGDWGLIKSEHVYGAASCPGGGSGVVVDVVVNDRAEHAQVWVEKSDHTMSYPPCSLVFR